MFQFTTMTFRSIRERCHVVIYGPLWPISHNPPEFLEGQRVLAVRLQIQRSLQFEGQALENGTASNPTAIEFI